MTISNTGSRDGRETVQLYLEPPAQSTISRPVRWLGGFASAEVGAGQSRPVTVVVPGRRFETWDTANNRWIRPAGTYRVVVGRSIRELFLDTAVQVETPREES